MIERVRREDVAPGRGLRPRCARCPAHALETALGHLSDTFEDAGWDDPAWRVHYEELELRGEAGQTVSVRRVLTLLRANLFRQELYEEALPIAQEEYALARELGQHEASFTAKYWITALLGKLSRPGGAAAGPGVRRAVPGDRRCRRPRSPSSGTGRSPLPPKAGPWS